MDVWRNRYIYSSRDLLRGLYNSKTEMYGKIFQQVLYRCIERSIERVLRRHGVDNIARSMEMCWVVCAVSIMQMYGAPYIASIIEVYNVVYVACISQLYGTLCIVSNIHMSGWLWKARWRAPKSQYFAGVWRALYSRVIRRPVFNGIVPFSDKEETGRQIVPFFNSAVFYDTRFFIMACK
jgi:hypothetical protein